MLQNHIIFLNKCNSLSSTDFRPNIWEKCCDSFESIYSTSSKKKKNMSLKNSIHIHWWWEKLFLVYTVYSLLQGSALQLKKLSGYTVCCHLWLAKPQGKQVQYIWRCKQWFKKTKTSKYYKKNIHNNYINSF